MTGREQRAMRDRAAALTNAGMRRAISRGMAERGLRQADVCALAGVTKSSLSRLLMHERAVTPLDRVMAALGMLDVETDSEARVEGEHAKACAEFGREGVRHAAVHEEAGDH